MGGLSPGGVITLANRLAIAVGSLAKAVTSGTGGRSQVATLRWHSPQASQAALVLLRVGVWS